MEDKKEFTAKFTSENDKKLGRCPETGARYLIAQGMVKHFKKEDLGNLALSCIDYGITQYDRIEIPEATLKRLVVTEVA